MPNTLTTIFTSSPSTEPVEAPHPNTGVYVTGTQLANLTWQVVHSGVTKTATAPTMIGRLKNFPAVTASIVASGNVLNNVLATPTGTSATGTTATAINVAVSSIANQTAYRLLASDAVGGPYTQIYQGTTASFAHTGLTASQTKYYQWQYVGGGFYDDSALSAVFSGATTPSATAPTLTGFTPQAAAVGAVVSLLGTNLTGATSVKVNGTTAVFTFVSDTQLSFTVPTAATTGTVSVTTPGGTATSTGTFTVSTATPGLLPSALTWSLQNTQLLQDYEPTTGRLLTRDFTAADTGSGLAIATPAQVVEGETASAWTPMVGTWTVDSGSPAAYRNGVGVYTTTTGSSRLIAVTGQVFTLFGPKISGGGTIQMQARRGGVIVAGPVSISVANASTTASVLLLTLDVGSIGLTTIEISSQAGTVAYDALEVAATSQSTTAVSTSRLRLATGNSTQTCLFGVGPQIGWWINRVTLAEAPVVSGGNNPNFVFGIGRDKDNWAGAVLRAGASTATLAVSKAGVYIATTAAPVAITYPCDLAVACTGTLFTLFTGPVGGTLTPVTIWNSALAGTPALNFNEKGYYAGAAAPWSFFMMAAADAATTLSVSVSKTRAGHFGYSAVGDNGIINTANGDPLILNNKLYFSGSLRGIYFTNVPEPTLLNNNGSAIFSLDLATVGATPAYKFESYVWMDFGTTTQGEGSPGFVYDTATGVWRVFTPTWHTCTDDSAHNVNLSRAVASDNLLTAGVHIVTGVVIVTPDPATPAGATMASYDNGLVRDSAGNWIWGYTQMPANGAFYTKIARAAPDFSTYTILRSDTGTVAEGIRIVKVGGKLYLGAANKMFHKYFNLDATDAGTSAQPVEVQNINYASHAAISSFVRADGQRQYLYIAFDEFLANGQYSYGKTRLYLSNQLETA